MSTPIEQIAAKETELAAAKVAFQKAADAPFGGSSRRKSFGVRVDANLRRCGQAAVLVQQLERELAALKRQADRPEEPVLDLSRLPYAAIVRTKYSGWLRVVKVNTKTVKVVAAPGMDDLIKISQIVAIRERAVVSASIEA